MNRKAMELPKHSYAISKPLAAVFCINQVYLKIFAILPGSGQLLNFSSNHQLFFLIEQAPGMYGRNARFIIKILSLHRSDAEWWSGQQIGQPSTAQRDKEERPLCFWVTRRNQMHMSAGTTIKVSAEGTTVRAVGHTSTRLEDTAFIGGINYEHVVRGSGITEFTFRVIDNVDPLNPEVPVLEVITISVSGPNGSLEVVLGGSGAPYSRTDGVEMVRTTDGLYRFELAGNPIQQR